jgi:lipid A 4'-phosphatase
MTSIFKLNLIRLFKDKAHCVPGCLGLLALSSMLFIYFPQIDIRVTQFFYASQGIFPANDFWLVKGIYQATPWLGRFAFLFALMVLLCAIFSPARVSRRHWRRASAVVAVIVLGIGLLVHTVLKDGMGRPRPRDVQIFMGTTDYVPVFVPSQFCQTNCSFVSGHAAVGFALMSIGMLSIRKRRRFWLALGLMSGGAIGLARIAQGGHFFSDVVFSLIAVWGSHLLIRMIWIRFRAWQLHKAAYPVSQYQSL